MPATARSFFERLPLYHFASPARFYPLAGRMIPWFEALALVLTLVGLVIGLFIAPTDAQQGEAYQSQHQRQSRKPRNHSASQRVKARWRGKVIKRQALEEGTGGG